MDSDEVTEYGGMVGRQWVLRRGLEGWGLSLMLFTYTIIKKIMNENKSRRMLNLFARVCIYVESQYTNANQRLNGHISNALPLPPPSE